MIYDMIRSPQLISAFLLASQGSSSEKVEENVSQKDKDVEVTDHETNGKEEEMETETAPKVVEEEMKEDKPETD